MHKIQKLVNRETTEVLRQQTRGGTFVFEINVAPRRESIPKDGTRVAAVAERVTAMRAARLLHSLAIVAEQRRAIKTSTGWCDIVTVAADLVGAIAEATGRVATIADLQRWARKYVPASAETEITSAFTDAVSGIPHPASAGHTIGLTQIEWLACGRPWGLHPVDISTKEFRELRMTISRQVDRARAQARRAQDGSRPHAQGDAEVCRRQGLNLRTYKRWKAKGPEALANWLASQGVECPRNVRGYLIKENTSDELGTPLPTSQSSGGRRRSSAASPERKYFLNEDQRRDRRANLFQFAVDLMAAPLHLEIATRRSQ